MTDSDWLLDDDNTVPFGKHTGKAISDLEPSYAKWLLSMADKPDFYYASWVQDHKVELKSALLTIRENPNQLPLLEDQQAASDAAYNAISNGAPVFRIQGGAGYGKSFVLEDIARRLKGDLGVDVNVSAPSYVATNNLMEGLSHLNILPRTLASALQLTPDHKSIKADYVFSGATPLRLQKLLSRENVFAVDECSMVDDLTGQRLIDAAHEHKGTLLLIGDAQQLPCPSQNTDSILCGVDPRAELTISKRFAPDSPLGKVERAVRSAPLDFNPVDMGETGSFSSVRSNRFIQAYVQRASSFPDETIMALFYANKDVAFANKMIRSHLFPDVESAIAAGERLRVQRTVFWNQEHGVQIHGSSSKDWAVHLRPQTREEIQDTQRFYSGVHHIVEDVVEDVVTISFGGGFSYEIPCHMVRLQHFNQEIPVLFGAGESQSDSSQRGGREYNAALREIGAFCSELGAEARNRYAAYHALKNAFLQVQYPYASTIHKVQGQTLDRAFVPFNRLRAVGDYNPYVGAKLLYVAMTRAKRELVWF